MVHRYLDPYIGMLKIDLKDVLYYKADFLLEMLFSIGYALLMIFVWTVLFESSGPASPATHQDASYTLSQVSCIRSV